MSIAGVLLAAGASTRMQFPKQLLTVSGETLLHRAARTLLEASCAPVVVVLGARAERMQSEVADLGVAIALNQDWQEGMGSSVRCGLARALQVKPDLEGALLALCDQPQVTAADFIAIQELFRRAGKPIAAAEYGATVGVPAVFAPATFPELLALGGAGGAREVIRAYETSLVRLPLPAALLDVDEPSDLQDAGVDPP